MAVTPQTPKCHHNRGAASVMVTFGSLWCHSHDRKRGINFNSIMDHKINLKWESFSSQTASQLSKFKGQTHCKHWVTWPDCFATPSNHCDVTARLVSLNHIDTLDKKMSQNMHWFKGNYKKKTLKIYCKHISKNIYILPLDKFANIIPTNTIIDLFDIILCIFVHFQHCF